jgi:hypothetical protein
MERRKVVTIGRILYKVVLDMEGISELQAAAMKQYGS